MKNPETFNQACYEAAREVADLVIKKQKDYGKKNIEDFGTLGLMVRANDKMARIKHLWGKEAVNEPYIDAWKDLMGYSLIALMVDRGWFALELEK